MVCAWDETVLHTFSGASDGGLPGYSNVTFDASGNIYGTAADYGGGSLCGVVWQLTRSVGGWVKSNIYSFEGGADGCNPNYGLIFDDAGNMYGTTQNAGANGSGTLFELSPSNGTWRETTLVQFGSATGTSPSGTLSIDASGNIYGTTALGGPDGSGSVFKLSPSGGQWNFSLVYSSAQCKSLSGVTIGADGNLYGACAIGGASGDGWVFKLPPTCDQSCTATDLHDFSGPDGSGPSSPVSFDQSGTLYGTTVSGGNQGCNNTCGVAWEIAF